MQGESGSVSVSAMAALAASPRHPVSETAAVSTRAVTMDRLGVAGAAAGLAVMGPWQRPAVSAAEGTVLNFCFQFVY